MVIERQQQGISMAETRLWKSGIGGPLFKMVDEVLSLDGIPPEIFLEGLRGWCRQLDEDHLLFKSLPTGGVFSIEKPVGEQRGVFDVVTLTVEPVEVEEEPILGRLIEARAVRSAWEVDDADGRKHKTGDIRAVEVNIVFSDGSHTGVAKIIISTQKEGQQVPLQVQLPLSRPIFS